MSTPKQPRTHIKTLDAVKAAIVILGLLLGILVALWFASRMTQSQETQPDFTSRPGKSLWE